MRGSVTVHMAAPPGRVWELVGPVRGRVNRYGMRATLERIKAVVE